MSEIRQTINLGQFLRNGDLEGKLEGHFAPNAVNPTEGAPQRTLYEVIGKSITNPELFDDNLLAAEWNHVLVSHDPDHETTRVSIAGHRDRHGRHFPVDHHGHDVALTSAEIRPFVAALEMLRDEGVFEYEQYVESDLDYLSRVARGGFGVATDEASNILEDMLGDVDSLDPDIVLSEHDNRDVRAAWRRVKSWTNREYGPRLKEHIENMAQDASQPEALQAAAQVVSSQFGSARSAANNTFLTYENQRPDNLFPSRSPAEPGTLQAELYGAIYEAFLEENGIEESSPVRSLLSTSRDELFTGVSVADFVEAEQIVVSERLFEQREESRVNMFNPNLSSGEFGPDNVRRNYSHSVLAQQILLDDGNLLADPDETIISNLFTYSLGGSNDLQESDDYSTNIQFNSKPGTMRVSTGRHAYPTYNDIVTAQSLQQEAIENARELHNVIVSELSEHEE